MTTTKSSYKIEFGVACRKISEQLAGSGLTSEELEKFDDYADAINRLLIRKVITESDAVRARKRLVKHIKKALEFRLSREKLKSWSLEFVKEDEV